MEQQIALRMEQIEKLPSVEDTSNAEHRNNNRYECRFVDEDAQIRSSLEIIVKTLLSQRSWRLGTKVMILY